MNVNHLSFGFLTLLISCLHFILTLKTPRKPASEIFFFFFFFFYLGFTALSRIFHLYRADHSSKVGENRSTRRKTTWPSVSRTWLSHIWPELGSNHSGEKPNGLRVNSLIHQATGARCIWKCRLFMSSADYSCKLFKTISAYRQTMWIQIKLLPVWSGSTLFAKMTFKIKTRWQSRQLLWLAV